MATPVTQPATEPEIKVYWQPGCSSCLRTKEFLTEHGVPFRSIDVLADPQAIADVAAYVATLEFRGRNGTGNGKLVSIGRSLFAMHCAACHGKSGEGNAGDAVPRVAGQHFAYLLGQFHEARAGSRRAFTAEHVQMLQGLDDDQLTGLADALSRMN